MLTVYIFYNLVYAAVAFPIGMLADKMGLKKIFISGLFLFAIVYGGMAYANQSYMFYILFLFYGIYAAATEGISKAWITNISTKAATATAIGTYSAFQSICTMIASSLAGFIWYQYGSQAMFLFSAIMVIFVAIFFLLLPAEKTSVGFPADLR